MQVHRREHSAKHVLVIGGEEASRTYVLDLEVRVGCCALRMGGIADVATREEHRNRGYARKVLNHCLEWMAAEGYDITMLIGIPDFYPKFGYATVMPEYRLEIPVEMLEPVESGLTVRPAEQSDREAIIAIYNATNATRSGTLTRRPDRWRWFESGTNWEIAVSCVAVCEGDKVVGYGVFDDEPGTARVADVAALSEKAYRSLLVHFRERAKTEKRDAVSVCAPIDHPFAYLARRLGCEVRVGFPRAGEGMARIIHLRPTMQKLLPELNRRLIGTAFHAWSGSLIVRTDIGALGLRCASGQWSLEGEGEQQSGLELPQWALIQLLMGYRTVADVLSSGGGKLVGQPDAGLLDALFPAQWPHMWPTDRF